MEKLTSPKVIEGILNKYDLHFNKRYGQNFLIDENIVRKIVEAGNVHKNDTVLEIPVLAKTLEDCNNVEIIQGDILKTDIPGLLRTNLQKNPLKIVANLPYYVTTPIIMGFLESELPIEQMTFMIQKEVGERLCAEPGTKAYGSLTIAAQFYAETEISFYVPAAVFMPRPKVDSIVVTLKKRAEPAIRVSDKKLFFQIVKASFLNRRKTLINGLQMNTDYSKERLLNALEKCGIAPGVRGETLTGEDFARLANTLSGE